ncbi:hypothetical protein DM02DRAFT_670625 [Periconia macrospinosa]|uniref:Uncharacterized protein n=1 Tax=Periconia macrospinosa TaxID=97972 RepID=A0A2V1DYP6_9PLEO|nr:hypothetical protein DM02DRAFT_670625 [Periconia macrospinosa]
MSLSSREMEVLALAWQCMDTEPKIDFEKLATLAGYGSRNSASVTFNNIRKKIKNSAPTSSSVPATPRKTKQAAGGGSAVKTPRSGGGTSTPGTKKRGAAKSSVVDAGTPSKKQKNSKSVAQQKVQRDHRDEDERTDFALSEDEGEGGYDGGPVTMEGSAKIKTEAVEMGGYGEGQGHDDNQDDDDVIQNSELYHQFENFVGGALDGVKEENGGQSGI